MGVIPLKKQCFVRRTHSRPNLLVSLPCDADEETIYEDFTTNHNKSLITINPGNNPDACTLEVIIRTDEEEISLSYPPPPSPTFLQDFIEVENLREIRVSCSGEGALGFCSGSFIVERDYCICCPQ